MSESAALVTSIIEPPRGEGKKFESQMKPVSDLLASELEGPLEIIDGLLSVGVNLLFARQNKGKTWMALQFADSVSSGKAFLGKKVLKTGKVLFYPLEDGERNLKKRVQLQWKEAAKPESVLYCENLKTANLGGFVELESEIALHRPILVVIDNMLAFMGHAAIKTNDASQMAQYLMQFRKLSKSYDVAFVLVHHGKKPSKDVDEEGPESALGSTSISALCDTRMQICTPDRTTFLQTWSKVFPNDRFAIRFDKESFTWERTEHDFDS